MKNIKMETNRRRRRREVYYEDLQVLFLLYIGLLQRDHDHEAD
jgi:hypothetical protein